MELEEPFKLGFLSTPPQSFLRKSWAKRFCALFNASSHGIQRLEIFDNDSAFLKQSKSPSKILPLTDCVKVTPAPQKQQANVFEVRTKSFCYLFSADSFQEMTDWLTALQTVSFGPLFASNLNVPQISMQNIKQEINSLYSSVDEPEIYLVKGLSTEAMLRNKLSGDYRLLITTTSICVTEDKPQHRILFTWPYRHIRRYGCSKDNFSFEAGRKCLSGEGLFAFATPDGSVIFQSVDSHVSSLRSSHCDSDVPLSPYAESGHSSVFSFKDDHKSKNDDLIAEDKSFFHSFSNKVSEGVNQVSHKAASHPISKPPRKSKPSNQVNMPMGNNGSNRALKTFPDHENQNFSANVYEDPPDFDVRINQKSEIIPNSEPISTASEPLYAVLEAEAFTDIKTLVNDMKDVHLDESNTSSRQNLNHQVWSHNSHRENDIFKTFKGSDHVYGKLLSSKSNSASSQQNHDNTYGSLKKKEEFVTEECFDASIQSYSNVQVRGFRENPKFSDKEPKHILQNDAEYARVFKNKK